MRRGYGTMRTSGDLIRRRNRTADELSLGRVAVDFALQPLELGAPLVVLDLAVELGELLLRGTDLGRRLAVAGLPTLGHERADAFARRCGAVLAPDDEPEHRA